MSKSVAAYGSDTRRWQEPRRLEMKGKALDKAQMLARIKDNLSKAK